MVADRVLDLVRFNRYTLVNCGDNALVTTSTSTTGLSVFYFPLSAVRVAAWADEEGSALTVRTAPGEASGANQAFIDAKQGNMRLRRRNIYHTTGLTHCKLRRVSLFDPGTLPAAIGHIAGITHASL
jgi:hypothetical protein